VGCLSVSAADTSKATIVRRPVAILALEDQSLCWMDETVLFEVRPFKVHTEGRRDVEKICQRQAAPIGFQGWCRAETEAPLAPGKVPVQNLPP
jgi:hypothetical protein